MNNASFLKTTIPLLLFIFGICGISLTSFAQEIDAQVTIDKSQISGTSIDYVDDLPDRIEEYINQFEWTDTHFNEHERINVAIQINLLAVENYNFEAHIIVRSQRPIYNSARETVVLIFSDEDWNFEYRPNRSFIHDELQFDALTSLIDFYAYIILGFDFDSFDKLGGDPYFQQAQNIASLARSSSASGWSQSSNRRNRGQLISNLRQTSYEPFRTAVYEYHRYGLDIFLDNPKEARQKILQALEKMQEAQRQTSNNLLFDTFFNAKYREITSIFEDAEPDVRLEAYNLLSDIDQSHLSEYEKLQ